MIDPHLRGVLDAMTAAGFRLPDVFSASEARALLDNPMPGPQISVASVRDVTIAGPTGDMAARLYHPQPGRTLPVTYFFHGGGWVLGTLDTHDSLARALAAASECAVLSLAYRLAPEHSYPAALDDCVAAAAALPAIAEGFGLTTRYALAGDSAGGNLAAAAAMRVAGSGNPPVHQLLFYPVIEADFATPSYRDASSEGFLTPGMMHWFWDQYAPGDLRDQAGAAPIRAASLAGVAPATIILAGNDPLHDEGVAYARALSAADVAVRLHDFGAAIHGFASLAGIVPIADDALQIAGTALRRALLPG